MDVSHDTNQDAAGAVLNILNGRSFRRGPEYHEWVFIRDIHDIANGFCDIMNRVHPGGSRISRMDFIHDPPEIHDAGSFWVFS